MARSAGVLLHISSLPSAYGIGDFGPEADRFVDWLAEAGFTWWQILPLNPPGYGSSPYQPWSACAGNRLFISPELLLDDRLLSEEELAEFRDVGSKGEQVDVAVAERTRDLLLRTAFERFEQDREYAAFLRESRAWLEDAVLFRVIHRRQGREWTAWPAGLRDRREEALERVRREEAGELEFERFCQYLFARQHRRLRRRAAEQGVRIIGDLPIFVAHDSADVWANRRLFDLDEAGHPRVVAGVPPDYFSATGQRWGNPLYRWERMAEEGYDWWIRRLEAAFELYDVLRLDHFRGFESYWEVPADEENAVNGRWVAGPGLPFFDAVIRRFGVGRLLAEDLGDITPAVDELREATGLPGMAVLQFGFPDPRSPHLPHNFGDANRVVYTGTHDNDTTLGWWRGAPRETKKFLRRYIGRRRPTGVEVVRAMRRLALESNAEVAILPMQDILELGSVARMNRPGLTDRQNWSWRMAPESLARTDPARLREELYVFDRLGDDHAYDRTDLKQA